MGYLHAKGIVHKDLKSKNVFYDNGKVVITDFGLFGISGVVREGRSVGLGHLDRLGRNWAVLVGLRSSRGLGTRRLSLRGSPPCRRGQVCSGPALVFLVQNQVWVTLRSLVVLHSQAGPRGGWVPSLTCSLYAHRLGQGTRVQVPIMRKNIRF